MDEYDILPDELFAEEEIPQIDLRELAINCMISFFEGREYESGGVIPRGDVLRLSNIAIVLEYQPACKFTEGLNLIHEILDKNEPPENFKTADWEVKFLSELLLESARLGVPKVFSIGMVILNLQYCYGMNKWGIWN